MTNHVWVSPRRNGGSHPRLHTDPDCYHLSRPGNERVVKKERNQYPEDAPMCKWCEGSAPTSANDAENWSHYRALRDAASGEQ